MRPVVVDLDYAELVRVRSRHRNGSHRDIGALRAVKINHAGHIHAVNMVRPKNRHQVGIGLLDQINILINRVGSALVPRLLFRTHLRRHVDDEVALQQPAELPALAQMLQQRLAKELSEHVNRVNAGIDEVAEDKIDDPVLASEWNGGLGAFAGQRIEPGAFPSG